VTAIRRGSEDRRHRPLPNHHYRLICTHRRLYRQFSQGRRDSIPRSQERLSVSTSRGPTSLPRMARAARIPAPMCRSPIGTSSERWQQSLRWPDPNSDTLLRSGQAPASSSPVSRQAGVIVCHRPYRSLTRMQIASAAAAGARMSTHLGNGSHAKIDRHPNPSSGRTSVTTTLWAMLHRRRPYHLPPPSSNA
jgi:hypothetical protein